MALTEVNSSSILDGAIKNADINASAAIDGSKISPVFTSNTTIQNTHPKLFLTDTNNNNDFSIENANGLFKIVDQTNSNELFSTNGTVIASKVNHDFSAGIDVNGDITGTGDLTLTSTDTGASASPIIDLYRNSASPSDADYLGQIKFSGESDDNSKKVYAKITGKIDDASSGTEDGIIEITHRKDGTNNISARFTSEDLKLINGTGLEVAGDTTLSGDLTINSTRPRITLNDTDSESDFEIKNENGSFRIRDIDNPTDRYKINSSGTIHEFLGSASFSSTLNVVSNITVGGTVDGVDIAARNTLFGGLTSTSGVLTNGVTATTQSAGDNSTKVATTAYTDTAITNLVDSSPTALNTLNELAAALGDDANFSTTVTNSIATKLPLAGGTLTGDVTHSDNVKAIFGTHSDLEIVHNSSENHFNFSANTFFKGNNAWGVRNSSNQNILQINGTNRTVELYGGSVRVISTASSKLTVRGGIEIENSEFNMTTNGNKILDFETGGTNFVNFRHNPSDSSLSTFMKAIHGGAVELYHDASGTKTFETTSTGIQVDGTNTNLTIRSGTASGTAGGLINFKNVDGNGIARDVARIKGFSDGTGGYGEITFQTAFNNSFNDVLRITKEQKLEIIGSNQYPVTIDGSHNGKIVLQGSNDPYIRFKEGSTDKAFIQWNSNGYLRFVNQEDLSSIRLQDDIRFSTDNFGSTNYKMWHQGNDGSGSGLDADTLDGQEGSYYTNASNLGSGTIPSARLSASDLLTLIKTVDGASSGLDADTLDGISSASFVRSDADDTLNGQYTISDGSNEKLVLAGSSNPLIRWQEGTTNRAYIQWNASSNFLGIYNQEDSSSIRLKDVLDFSTDGINYHQIWHSGNDGAGSGLDADTVDGLQASSFLRSDANDSTSGILTLTSSSQYPLVINGADNGKILLQGSSNPYIKIREGTTDKVLIQWQTNGYLRIKNHEDNSVLQIKDNLTFSTDGETTNHTIWHAGNDGAGSGLDADTLDGQQGSYYTNAANLTGTLPAIDGSNLTGISAGATGGGSDECFVETDQSVTTSYTLSSNKNAVTISPEINSGVTITVPSGATLVIL